MDNADRIHVARGGMRLVFVDAYDSFTHNLTQAFAILGVRVDVVRCDETDSDSLLARHADLYVFGPGPGRPEDAGCFVDAVRTLCGRVPILGVCLGHQTLAVALGGSLLRYPPVHGRATPVFHDGTSLFDNVASGVQMGRYHSLGINPDTLPSDLQATSRSEDGVIMSVEHKTALAWGVQFHPESVMSGEPGMQILRNFLRQAQQRSPVQHALRSASTDSP